MKGEELKELLLHLPVELYEEVKEAIGEYGVSIHFLCKLPFRLFIGLLCACFSPSYTPPYRRSLCLSLKLPGVWHPEEYPYYFM